MIKVAVVGASGYTGAELLRLLACHPEVEVVSITSRKEKGRLLKDVFPSLALAYPDLHFEDPEPKTLARKADLVFCCVPHRAAMAIVPDLLAAGVKVVDFSADFRLKDPATYERWYETKHTAPELLDEAVYGLPEIWREEIMEAHLVAGPGCYPTSVILPLHPLLSQGLIEREVIIDSKSGVSGAGRAAKLPLIFAEVNEAFRAYGLPGHRHIPEMEQELSFAAGSEVRVSFVPHLLPITRGILSTIYVFPRPGVSGDHLREALKKAYQGEPFVSVLPPGELPDVAHVRGTNQCRLAVVPDERTARVVIISVIDNLVKGAAGQALQCMNLMCGLKETMGLVGPALYP
ncbi:N-acetyl-gamma-glutamyl-phosphate reductase [Thermosulfuriphilus ammonigenes]|uniref:N-acetyl-gamma-glutamyl-phosphate reductase n=1 Tax=Thermosulfuriphilus ammonigenes TaxID=1936021 RepID=A0A6G7PTT3_9BACT|nr:N-acetyl-gamma-glutamyl-phosphate reductase [Thermosulfuriphilus ammonigenes]MBA2848777.1 N-acetyl-gamma-glutamyl-phosphate reductase [Thermosulfuriphilus ammonigenes]QIJ71094.1 N-acetyl-gamma-glutamyl-phosphate reductase [Thermosulfuriphilus ammonigenes]